MTLRVGGGDKLVETVRVAKLTSSSRHLWKHINSACCGEHGRTASHTSHRPSEGTNRTYKASPRSCVNLWIPFESVNHSYTWKSKSNRVCSLRSYTQNSETTRRRKYLASRWHVSPERVALLTFKICGRRKGNADQFCNWGRFHHRLSRLHLLLIWTVRLQSLLWRACFWHN